MAQWIADLDSAKFDFSQGQWVDLELTGAELRKFNAQHPRNPDGTFKEKGSGSSGSSDSGSSDGDNKNGSSSDGGSKSGKSSGPARFKDSNGDGKDDRQLTPAELKKALSGLSADMRQALQIYPAVLGAIKMALENDEDPTKHLERLPLRLRGAAERAAKSVASGGSKSKSYKGMSARQISDLPDDERMAIPQSELPDPPSGYTWAEDRSLVPNSFYNAESSAWFVDLDELEGRDIKSLAPTDVLIRQMDWATFVERGGKTLKKFEQPGGESPDTNLDRAKDWALRFAKKLDGEPRVFLSVDESGQIDEEITRQMSEPVWSVNLDDAFFDFHELAWRPDGAIELANGKKSKVSALIRKLRADPRVDDPERLAGWIKHHRGSGKSSGNGSGGSGSSSSRDSSDSNSSSKPDKPSGRMVGGFYIDDDDEDEFLSDPFIDEEPKTKEEIEQEKYEAKVLRELEREVPENIYKTIMEFGGLKTRPDLREEYSEIPNVYKRKDGTDGDELADMLAQFYPQYGIETERDLIDFLAA